MLQVLAHPVFARLFAAQVVAAGPREAEENSAPGKLPSIGSQAFIRDGLTHFQLNDFCYQEEST